MLFCAHSLKKRLFTGNEKFQYIYQRTQDVGKIMKVASVIISFGFDARNEQMQT